MSNGSNSANLLLAARLIEANVNRADEAEEQLQQERMNRAIPVDKARSSQLDFDPAHLTCWTDDRP